MDLKTASFLVGACCHVFSTSLYIWCGKNTSRAKVSIKAFNLFGRLQSSLCPLFWIFTMLIVYRRAGSTSGTRW